MKIGIFTDPHYCRTDDLGLDRRPALSLKKITEAMEAFRAAGADLCFCLGDLTDHAPNDTREDVLACFQEITSRIRSYGIPFYAVPGNHDYLMMTAEELEREADIPVPPYTVSCGGWDFIVLDANYRSSMERFDRAGAEWTDANLPPEQIAYLEEVLSSSDRPCAVLIHENLDPSVDPSHIVRNAAEVRAVLKTYPRVRLVLQGHYHPGAENTVDGILYRTFPAMCQGEKNAYFVLEF